MMMTYAFPALNAHASDRFRRAVVGGLIALGLATAALPISLQAEERTLIPLETISATAQQMHPGEPLKVELKRKRGREVYTAEILDAVQNAVWKLRFDARTGELLKEELETEHDHARRLHREGAIVSLESVVDVAQGMRAGDLLEVELEHKHGQYIYEVEILDPSGQVWELRFDAHDGAFLREEADD